LFESLAALESVHAERFQFVYTTEGTTEGWRLDRASFEKAAKTKNARAALFVHPNNPTGALLRADDWAFIKAICAEHKIAIIVDEVFLDYAEQSADTLGTTAGEKGAGTLVFTLNGLSKTAALPQLKLSWIVTSGPGELVAQALERLDVVNDAFLSCASPVQNALGDLLKIGENLRAQISARLKENSALLETLTLPQNTHVLKRDGGWYAVLRLPDHILEEPFCLKLLKQHGVLAHPGFFYDFPAAQAHLVLSLLPKSAQFATAIRTILPP